MYSKGCFHSECQMYVFEIAGAYVTVWKPERDSIGDHGKLTPVFSRSPTMNVWYDDKHKHIMSFIDGLTALLKHLDEQE